MKKIFLLMIICIVMQGCTSTENNKELDLNLIASSVISTGIGSLNNYESFDIVPFYKEKTRTKGTRKSDSFTTIDVKKIENGSITNSRTETRERTKTKSTRVGFGIF